MKTQKSTPSTGKIAAAAALLIVLLVAIVRGSGFVPAPAPVAQAAAGGELVEVAGDCTDLLDGATDYATFEANARAGYLQMVTIPWTASMAVLDDYGYLDVEEGETTRAYHTFAIARLGQDARTGLGCYQAWAFDGRPGTAGYGESFCISEPDMLYLFERGAYYLAYRTY